MRRGLPAISGEYAIYTPPYLYLLWVVSLASGKLSDVTLIKLISVFFTAVAGGLVFLILRQLGRSVSIATIAASLFLCLPTVVINSVYWGQSDIIYTCLLLAFFLCTQQ